MHQNPAWKNLGWDHPLWDLVRYYRSLRHTAQQNEFRSKLKNDGVILTNSDAGFPVTRSVVELLEKYLASSALDIADALSRLRTEEEAKAYCSSLNVKVGQTTTRNQDHHQSSKALVAAVSSIAESVCAKNDVKVELNPQRRCVWCSERGLHVSARNLDGAIPTLLNPTVVWEIKEYWGGTGGGSKMSDAVYECHLVGRELRDFEGRSGVSVVHVVFLDGKVQWGSRKSDMLRFIDLFHQGLINNLLIGKDVENEWEILVRNLICS